MFISFGVLYKQIRTYTYLYFQCNVILKQSNFKLDIDFSSHEKTVQNNL